MAVRTLGMSAASNLMAETRGDVSHRDSLDSGSLWEGLTVLKKGDSKQFSSAQRVLKNIKNKIGQVKEDRI